MAEIRASRYSPLRLEEHKGKRFVVKLGGEVMLNGAGLHALCADIATLAQAGVSIVVVHGGGPQADSLAEKLGHSVRKVAGRRVTDDNALEIAKMVYGGSINVEILGALKRAGAQGVGLSGVDGGLVTVTRRPPILVRQAEEGVVELVDFGHVGDIERVDVSLLNLLFRGGYVPVVASLAADAQGTIYNINADTVAQALAAALTADRLYILTNVPGILLDPDDVGSLLTVCTREQAQVLVAQGVISGGMLPKVQNCLQALQDGVQQVQMLDGTQNRSLLLESLANAAPVGTLMVGTD